MNTNEKLIKIIHELVRKAYFCIFATTKDRTLSEGGLITASKTYLKSAIVVVEELEPPIKDNEVLKKTMEMLKDIMSRSDKKQFRFDVTDPIIRKKFDKVKSTAKWLLNKLEKKVSM